MKWPLFTGSWCRRWIIGVLWAAVPLGVPAWAAAGQPPQPKQLAKLLNRLPQASARCSAVAVELDTGQTLCSVNPREALIPASNAKLLVLAAAVDQLGPDFAFRTRLVMRGSDLVVVGDGDPALGDVAIAETRGESTDAALAAWAEALASAGVAQIPGNLVYDDSIFDDQHVHPGWEVRHLKKWYGAPVGGLNYNDNCIDLTIWPAPGGTWPPRWESVPPLSKLDVVFRKPNRKGDPILDRPAAELRLVITGRPTKRWLFPPVPAPDPGYLTAEALRHALAARGITIRGDTRRQRVRQADGTLPADCRVVAEHVMPLAPILSRTGKKSQNLFAECLLKRLGYEWARRRGVPDPQGSWQNGQAAVREFLDAIGENRIQATVVDGSGLSRSNRTSAADLLAVLEYMHRHPDRELFVGALAVAGTDGSLAKRMKDLPGAVFAKTGYLNSARTLSGYAVTPQGHWRAFSVLFNGFKGGSAPYNRIHDEVCRILTTDPPGTAR